MAGPGDPCPPRPQPVDDGVLNPERWLKRRRGVVFRPGDPVEPQPAPERMVRWLSPTGLASSAFRVLLAGIFGLYSDKREIEDVLPQPTVPDRYADRDEVWIDYVADLADGWNPTYAVARALAQPSLDVDGTTTNRGDILVMGGDQVYPFATEAEYGHRMIAPFQAALPCTTEAEPPRLYAIPGNHDWYDGLTTFMRLFCRRQWVGGWRTEQQRSYFALRLPGDWWLWGLDIQFDFYIDGPQLDFFDRLARTREQLGDKLILCTAKPSWVHRKLERDEKARGLAGRNLEYFEREIIRKHGWQLMVAISGDHHHYARYEPREGLRHQRITCGGGGAFLYPTHGLPEDLDWAEADEPPRTAYRRAKEYPDVGVSRRLRWKALQVPFTNPSFWVLIGVVYVLLAWMVRFGLGVDPSDGGFLPSLGELLVRLIRNPTGLLFALLLLAALVGFASMGGWGRGLRLVVGPIHGAVHVLLCLVMLLLLILVWVLIFEDLPSGWAIPVPVVVLGVVGGLLGSLLFGGYLLFSQSRDRHPNEAFSSAHIQDYKSFLRLRVDRDGSLTIYPVGLDHVPQKWQLVPEGDPTGPWFRPVDRELTPRLIEPPIPVGERG
jgi:Calcineurin-like phosphoesterase